MRTRPPVSSASFFGGVKFPESFSTQPQEENYYPSMLKEATSNKRSFGGFFFFSRLEFHFGLFFPPFARPEFQISL